MDEILPPVGDEELRHVDHEHLGGHRAATPTHVLQDDRGDVAVGRGQERQRHGNTGGLPLAQNLVLFLVIGDDGAELDRRR